MSEQTEQTVANAPATTTEQVSEAPTFVPPTDIYETKDALIMVLEVPGADPDSLNVTVEANTLTAFARSTPSAPQGYTLAYAEYREEITSARSRFRLASTPRKWMPCSKMGCCVSHSRRPHRP